MIRTRILGTALAAATTLALLSPAFADEAKLPTGADPFGGAWDDLAETEGTLLTPKQFVDLTNIAYQVAVVRVCDAHGLDSAKLATLLDDILTATDRKLTETQTDERTAAILMAFGARYGLFLAEAHTNVQTFCDSAAALKSAPGDVPMLLK